MPKHPLIEKIFKGLNEDGYWGRPKDIRTWWPKKDATFWLLPVLADFGLNVEDKRIARACEYVFSIQLESGGFGWSPPTKPSDCRSAIITESLAKRVCCETLGYKEPMNGSPKDSVSTWTRG